MQISGTYALVLRVVVPMVALDRPRRVGMNEVSDLVLVLKVDDFGWRTFGHCEWSDITRRSLGKC